MYVMMFIGYTKPAKVSEESWFTAIMADFPISSTHGTKFRISLTSSARRWKLSTSTGWFEWKLTRIWNVCDNYNVLSVICFPRSQLITMFNIGIDCVEKLFE